jgi:putative transposon-encoded protein
MKMKNIKYTLIALLSLPLFLVGCMNDDFVSPDASGYSAYSGKAVNTTIADLLAKYAKIISNDSIVKVDAGTIIEGTVISSDANGNFYQQIVIQDATGGIQLSVAGKGLHIYYPIGQKVVVNCDQLYIGGYGNSALLGADYMNTTKGKHQVGRMSQALLEASVTPDGQASASNLPEAKVVSKYTELKKSDMNTLVTLKDVSFDDAHYKAFAPEAEQDGGYAVDRNLSFSNGSYLVVRTSSYANFANTPLPGGTGDLTGVMGYYRGTYQFVLRDYTTDLSSSFTKYDALRVPLFSETFATSLGQMTATHPSTAGAVDWTYSSSYKCAMVSGYDKSTKVYTPAESYLISPAIDLSGLSQAFISFKGAIAYATTATVDDCHQLLISSDFSGDPAKATWKVLPFSKSASTKGSFNFVGSGKVGIPSAYLGKKVYVALRYKCTDKTASTWEVNNLMVDEGKGSIIYFSESLIGGDAGFTAYSVSGSQTWSLNTTYGFKISGYSKGNKENEDWAVSPEIDLTGGTDLTMSFDHTIKYANGNPLATYHTLWITDNFTGDVTTTKWTQVPITSYPTGDDWTFVNSGNISVPSAFAGKKVHIAFKYVSTTSVATTWEVKNLLIKD